jgi:penicillin-binding protein 1A
MTSMVKSGVALAGLLIFGMFFYIGISLTQTTTKMADFFTGISSWEYKVKQQTVVYYSDGTEMGTLGYQRQYSQDFPEFLKQAVVAVEDRRFYQHAAFDAQSIGRAIYNDLRAGSKAEGASTITQQLARTLFLSQEKTFTRKIKELFIAIAIEDKYTKDAILNMYLNEVYTGRGGSGMASAANSYFGKDVSQLNKAEMTILAGIIQAPEYYSPDRNMDGLKQRQQDVVDILVEQGILTQAEGQTIMKQKLNIMAPRSNVVQHPYYMSYLANILEDEATIGAQKLYGGGLHIYTTIDRTMQEAAEASVASNAQSFASRGITAKDVALASIDPATGGIKAMVGGVDWSKNQINMAISPRQPGSAIKPLYYAAALNENVIKADTNLNNKKRDFNGYSPDNYAASPEKVTVTEALVHSYNVASVEVLSKLGVTKAVKYLELFGITTVDPADHNLALALGGMTRGISPLQLAAAYGVFPAQGRAETPFTVIKITDTQKKVIYEDHSISKRVISSATASSMDKILKAVVNQGTGSNARISVSSGGKTGTTEGKSGTSASQDLWYVGYTAELVTAVWVGNSDNSEIKGFGTYGGTVCGPVWRDYMNRVIAKNSLGDSSPAADADNSGNKTTTEPDQNKSAALPDSAAKVDGAALPAAKTRSSAKTTAEQAKVTGSTSRDRDPTDAAAGYNPKVVN